MVDRKEYMKAYYEKNKHKWKEEDGWKKNWVAPPGYHLKYQQTIRGLYTRVRTNAKARGIEFSIEMEDLVMPDICPVLGIEIRFRTEVGKPTADPFAPSLDRIDNTKGYIKGNVRIISYRANVLKNNMTKEEARLLYENFEKI